MEKICRTTRPTDASCLPANRTTPEASAHPGEPFEDVYSQIYDVPKVDFKDVPSDPPKPPSMQGFYPQLCNSEGQACDPTKIMESLTPKTLPVLSSLAHHYAVCDRWFASIPHRPFATVPLCTPAFISYVNNGGGGLCFVMTPHHLRPARKRRKDLEHLLRRVVARKLYLIDAKTALEVCADQTLRSLQGLRRRRGEERRLTELFFHRTIYFDSVVWGRKMICTRMQSVPILRAFEPSSGRGADRDDYDAIRNSPDWESTLLIILFDEHGGCYDHVPPPSAPEVRSLSPQTESSPRRTRGIGFKFDRLGPRVPAIIISAYTPRKPGCIRFLSTPRYCQQ